MKNIFIIGIFLSVSFGLRAQYNNPGHLIIIQDPRIDSVLQQYEMLRLQIMNNPDNKAIPGYRIQIFFDSGLNSSDRARQAMEDFLLKYPEIPAYVSWKAPNYRVRVGDFKIRLEAEKTLQHILSDYPNAWISKDEINFPLIN